MNHRFEWLYLVAFVHPESGRNLWYLLPVLNTLAFQAVLDDFAATVFQPQPLQPNPSKPSKRILIVMDQAGWHTSKDLHIPQAIELVFQPAHSPEVQPCERLWVLSDQALENRCFGSISALEDALSRQCVRLMEDPDRVRAQTFFWWWPRSGM